jgi:hypothetical protein
MKKPAPLNEETGRLLPVCRIKQDRRRELPETEVFHDFEPFMNHKYLVVNRSRILDSGHIHPADLTLHCIIHPSDTDFYTGRF